MSIGKIVLLLVYAVLAVLAVTQGDSAAGLWSLRILAIIAAVHLFEVLVFFPVWRTAPGALAGHVLQVFLFGVLHVQEIKAARAAS